MAAAVVLQWKYVRTAFWLAAEEVKVLMEGDSMSCCRPCSRPPLRLELVWRAARVAAASP